MLTSHRTKAPAQTTTTTGTTSSQNRVQPDTVTDTSSKTYTSNGKDLNLSFTYPAGWTVQPASNSNPDDKQITVTSPLATIASADNKSVTGRVVLSIRPGGSTITELAGDKATAAQASTQIAYDKPTSAQHQYPYISFAHLAGGTNPTNAFEEVIVTGITNFAKNQAVYQTSLAQLDPIISARFYTCGDQSCTATTPLSITNGTWQNNDTTQQALAIFESLQIN
jgi:hypothetical protein